MSLLIIVSYAVLAGVIAYLLMIIASQKTEHTTTDRGSILTPEELKKYAEQIARNHPVGKSARSFHWLIRKLNENYAFIKSVYKTHNADVGDSSPVAPAAEWLLDNFYIIEEQVKLIRKNLSRGQYTRLPVLKGGYLKGYPRIYAIAFELVSHSDGRIDTKRLIEFLNAYQSQTLLSMGELWAFPLMLRIALIDSIRNVCGLVDASRKEWRRAESIAAYLSSHELDEQQINSALEEALNKMEAISPSFVEHLLQKLRKNGKGLYSITALLDKKLRENNSSTEKITDLEHRLQAEMQVSIGNSVTALRLISDIDWADIFEELCKVEHILSRDPCGIYRQMDFESRDYYRHEVEKLARAYGTSEINVANKVIDCCLKCDASLPKNHVGYYLLGKGRKILSGELESLTRSRWRNPFATFRKPKFLYAALILFLTAFLVAFLMNYAYTKSRSAAVFYWIFAGLLVLIPSSETAINLVNTLFCNIIRATKLPKLELSHGIPRELATFVIVPTLLTSPVRVKELLLQLEVYYLANKDENLFFALVGDFKDSDREEREEDEAILKAAVEGVDNLNKKYPHGEHPIFYFLHRKRTYNESQNRWMGWERKRGAIVEFNRLLRGAHDTGFTTITGDISKLPEIRYVITLDADTNLPMGAARRLIGTIAHPLNKAVLNEKTGLVAEGFGLLQPRISVSITEANRSAFTKIFAGQGGIDPYTTAVSDIYQDIFDEGIFTGKGIYEVDIFIKVLHERIPENSVLSHDLLEGCHLRAGLVSDIELVDGYPSRYNSYSARQHRWVRGDWQLLPWLCSIVTDASGKRIVNNLSFLSRWKIFDNLRRSLLYPSLLALIFAGLFLLPGSALAWTGYAVFATFLPLVAGFLNSLLSGNLGFRYSRTNSTVITGVKAAIYQSLMLFMFMPYQAYLMLDAIIRTIIRVTITHKNMLEWVTAADVEAGVKNSLKSFLKKMWVNFLAAFAVVLFSLQTSAASTYISLPMAVLWFAGPFAAYLVSSPCVKKQHRLSEEDIAMLRSISRKTWRYFEDFAVEQENYLPPDNYQEEPPKGLAHRTSPTNIGLLLLSVLCACDLGYIGILEMASRFENIISTLEKMEKWKGHLYNWYNTITLEILKPMYISTVDSGNLVGYMMVVREGLKEYLDRPVLSPALADGLYDTIILLCRENGLKLPEDLTDRLKRLSRDENVVPSDWAHAIKEVEEWLSSTGVNDKNDWGGWSSKLSNMLCMLSAQINTFYPHIGDSDLKDVIGKKSPDMLAEIDKPGSMQELADRYRLLSWVLSEMPAGVTREKLQNARDRLQTAGESIEDSVEKIRQLIRRLSALIDNTDFSPLFDKKRMLFAIGYNAEDGQLSKSYYDLLASEARQASYIAIARGDVDRRNWIRLGRKMTSVDGGKALISWTGTMFEYMMPLLIMRNYENTILDETYTNVVRLQKRYGKIRCIPWGISESGYSAFDYNLNYQYKAFGVPELGLKRGLASDMVVAPYATLLALCVEPEDAVENLKELSRLGMDAKWGYYEAIDFTPSRLERNVQCRIVKSFMAHHQGMNLASLNNFFNSNILQKRFHSDPVIKSAELLLQERIHAKPIYTMEHREEYTLPERKTEQAHSEAVRTFGVPDTLPPNAHILSNGQYSVMLTDGGSGYSVVEDIAINRWNGDYLKKDGIYIFIQNINSNTAWSATYEPNLKEPERYKVVFSPDKAEFSRRDGNIETYTEVTVSPEDDAEIRRVSITNHSQHERIVEVTSYFETVLAPAREDAAHPAFSKLFVKTEYVKEYKCLLAERRHRSKAAKVLWLLHTMAVEEENAIGDLQYETDRMKFIGRNRDITNPVAMEPDQPVSNSTGAVLDPVMCLRRRVRIEPGKTVKISFTTAVAQTRKYAMELAEKYMDIKTAERMFELSWTRSQVESRYLGLDAKETESYLELLPFILYPSSFKKNYEKYIAENTYSQSDLWPFGISGDLPIILVEVNEMEDLETVRWALKGHEFWRVKGIFVDLVILINKKEGYFKPLNDQVLNAIAASHARELSDTKGGVFVRNTSSLDESQTVLFYTAARLVVRESLDRFNSLIKAAKRSITADMSLLVRRIEGDEKAVSERGWDIFENLRFFNGIGGFSKDGREYVILLRNGMRTPAPWSNIVAGKNFGFLVTESGGGYTWAENSREYKLTPWANDPVSDPQGEVFYISDLDEENLWSITPMPAGDEGLYVITHGFGYSKFQHVCSGLEQELTMFVPLESRVKVCIISMANLTDKKRSLSITYYTRPVLGVDENLTSPYIVTREGDSGLLFIENKFSVDFKDRMSFIGTSIEEKSFCGDRDLFLSSGGKAAGTVGAGLNPCAAVSGKIVLEPGQKTQVVFLLGNTRSEEEAYKLAEQFTSPDNAIRELERVKEYWRKWLGVIQIHTPDDSFDTIINGWLMYQVVACRIWSRTAYYQAGGAYGFRDQLQDSMALLNTWPALTRRQILLHASRQFKEGDVQHWWHAEKGRGIRTRYSDDLLWLAYVTCEYVEKTGDVSILNEQVPFLEGRILEEGEDERYDEPVVSDEHASLYEHCALAIDRSLNTGPHGLPLIGCGDWNDGMNTVGNRGKGESVWLGWFLLCILNKFIRICRMMKDEERGKRYFEAASRLLGNIEKEAWDGSWYRRAYFDDGTPLGSVQNTECRIDSISQSWSVISEVAKQSRMKEAMNAVQKYLIDRHEGVIKLLTPPFSDGELEPGYIKSYVPGVRENGGQYTHAAAWTVMAFAKLGMGDTASELFHMINPINHTRTQIEYSRYKAEPYVVAADVYGEQPHVGRGGWTWYTGAAGWLYKVGIEYIAGFRKKGNRLYIEPCIPGTWERFEIEYRFENSSYHIEVKNPEGVSTGVVYMALDNKQCMDGYIELKDDGGEHFVEIVMGRNKN